MQIRGPAYEILFEIQRRHPQITRFTLSTYQPHEPLEDRLRDRAAPKLLEIFEKARELRSHWSAIGGLPYWSSIFATRAGLPEFDFFVGESLKSASDQQFFSLNAADLTPDKINELLDRRRAGDHVGAGSACTLREGSIHHIPMIDFRIAPEPSAIERLRRMLHAIGQNDGCLVFSGNSFHFWGLTLLAPMQWQQFLGRLLLFAPLIDTRHVARALLRGQCVLRVSSSGDKPVQPEIVALL
jgi:hypothetical protein